MPVPVGRLATGVLSIGMGGVASMTVDLLYYRRRQAEEKAAAAAAPDSRVGAIHLELARRYEERLKLVEDTIATLHLVSAA